VNEELSRRARHLVATRGHLVDTEQARPTFDEFYVGIYWLVVYDGGHLQIRTGFVREIVVYSESDSQKVDEGWLRDPILAAECLQLMREMMILDDLASIADAPSPSAEGLANV